jgi:hypothetical protein
VCARIPYYTEFSRDNPAYCKDFAADNNVGHWIPISEKLPDIDVKVIVYDAETGIMHTGAFDGMLWHLGDGGWLLDLDDFTHWMHLPEPPKEG